MNTTTNATRQKSICAVLSTLLFVAMLFSALFLTGCSRKVSDFTEEQHKQRITERLQKRIDHWSYAPDKKFEGFELYPLYNENEELSFFLIELEPCAFVFVDLVDESSIIASWLDESMYPYRDILRWSPYKTLKVDDEENKLEKQWITDSNGEIIVYERSPYYITGNINNKKYILTTYDSNEYICAVRKDDLFENLISGELFNIENKDSLASQATITLLFYHGKNL